MKNTIIFLISFLFLSTTFAAVKAPSKIKKREDINFEFKCLSGMPTTSFIMQKSDKPDILKLKMIHHNGTAFMPIFQGIVVPNDLQYLKEKAELMSKMGDYVEFEFPLEYCKKYDDQVYSCSHGSSLEINGVIVEAFSLTTQVITRKVYDYNWTNNRINLMLYFPGHAPVEEVTMDYYENECQF